MASIRHFDSFKCRLWGASSRRVMEFRFYEFWKSQVRIFSTVILSIKFFFFSCRPICMIEKVFEYFYFWLKFIVVLHKELVCEYLSIKFLKNWFLISDRCMAWYFYLNGSRNLNQRVPLSRTVALRKFSLQSRYLSWILSAFSLYA